MNKKIVLALILITLLGGFLRFYKMAENPTSLNGDEISFGYAAYSILTTGRDEHGKFMPLTFESVGDFKNPLPAYLMVFSIKLFGLSDFSVRFQNAFFGTLTILLFFFFLLNITKGKSIALTGAFFISISSWHIFYSRYAYEALIASFFVLIGIWFFIKMLDGNWIYAIFSAFFLVLTMYTSFAPRLFIPVFILATIIYSLPKIKHNWGRFIIFISACIVFVIPLAYVTFFKGAGTRFSMVFIGNDIEFTRYILLHHIQSISDIPVLIFFWIKRYLNYLQPDFIFFNGLNMTLPGTFGLGILYLFELPWLIMGIFEFMKRKIPYKGIFLIWLLTGIIPDSLTNNQQHAGRLLHVLPIVIFITTLGALRFFKWINSFPKISKIFIYTFYTTFIVITLSHAFLTFATHFPRDKAESFDEKAKEAIQYILKHQNEYKEIVFDTRRGTEGPYLVGNPHMYLLFYSKYDPKTYQTEPKVYGSQEKPYFEFNKYIFRNIDWLSDRDKKGVLFIGSQWVFPEKDMKKGEILEKIYMTNGNPAFYIVTPK